MTFKTGHKRGEQKKSVTVTSNEPHNPDAQLYVIVNNSLTGMLRVTDFRDPDDRMEFDLVTVQEGKQFELIVRPKDTSSITGTVTGTITIVTDHPEQKELTVPYTLTPQS